MNQCKIYTVLFLIFYCSQNFCISNSEYIISKNDLVSICSSSTIANFPISIEILRSYPMDDNLLNKVNDLIIDFWEIYEQHEDVTKMLHKECAYHLLAKMNIDMVRSIQNMDNKDVYVKSRAYIIWGYALLVIHYQIAHTIS